MVDPAVGFSHNELEEHFAFIDRCPSSLLPQVITLPLSTLEKRVAGACGWYEALLGGRLPPVGSWPNTPVDVPVRLALESMGMARFFKDQPKLAQELMRDILRAFARQDVLFQVEIATKLRELQQRERTGREQALGPGMSLNSKQSASGRVRLDDVRGGERLGLAGVDKQSASGTTRLDDVPLERLRELAKREVANREREPDSELIENWAERACAWGDISDVFGDIGQMAGRGWDMSLGVLKHTGWVHLLRFRELLEKLPLLRELVRSLGRLQDSNNSALVIETPFVPVKKLEEKRREVPTPRVLSEVRCVERSGSISRMLPAESAMLGHGKLRLLWHARRAERALQTYRVEGVEVERIRTEPERTAQTPNKQSRPDRGPIIAVIDTSGSMRGLPEQVAKAIALQAARTAHAEKRQCFLYAFSGPGQVLEHELDLSPDGIGRLLSFLDLSFGGGSDMRGVMRKVLKRLGEKKWRKADVICVSDGEWPVDDELVTAVESARERGTRFHGVQIGNQKRSELNEICDPVHVFP